MKKLILLCFFIWSSSVGAVGDGLIFNLKFDLSSWPKETQTNLIKNIPELKNSSFSEEEINQLIKKIQSVTRLKKIKIIKTDLSLKLQAETDSQIEEIVFENSPLINDSEAIEIINLGLSDANDVNKVNAALDKLINYYRNLGYQKTSAQFQYSTGQDFKKRLVIRVTLGPRTLIQGASFQGLNPADAAALKNNIYWNYIGENFTDDRLKKMNTEIRTYLNQRGLYLVVTPSPQIIYNSDDTRVTLIYKFIVKPKYEIQVLGSQSYTEYHLKGEVLKLAEYSPNDESFPDDLLTKLQKFYLSQGYNNNIIKYTLSQQNGKNILTYQIIENTKTSIYEIKFMGQFSRPEKYYRDLFNEYASQAVQEGIFIKSDIEQAAKNLIVALKNQGFVNAKLKKLDMTNDLERPERGLVQINLDEGIQTRISKFNFKNNHFISGEQLVKEMGLSNAAILNLNELEAGLNKVQTYYANQGFLEMKITNLNSDQLVSYNDDYSLAQINVDINEGPQITVQSILIDGNIKTHERVILKEIEFQTGDILTLQKLQESTARLQKTGLFSSIQIKMLENNTSISNRTVLLTVSERKPGIVNFGVGVTNENNLTLRGYSGIAYRNLGGWGRGVSLRGDGSYNPTILNFLESKFTIGFLEPYLFDSRLRFRINYTTSRTVTDYTVRQKTIANQAVWSIEQDITSHVTGIWQIYNIANYVDEGISREDEIRYNYSRKDIVIASVGPVLDVDYRDNALNPLTGHFSRFSLEYATNALGSNHIDDFLRGTAQTTLYHNFFDQVVWANSLRGGYMKPLKTSDTYGVRFDKKGFILGGRTTIRGFESDEFFPATDSREGTRPAVSVDYELRGDTSYSIFKSELRFPLFKKSDLFGAVFYDGGRVDIAELPTNTNYRAEWRDSIGIGIRYNLPIGPLNLEYAHKLNKKDYESDGAFHLSVGVF